jgi:DNA-binding NtrC family response regulator
LARLISAWGYEVKTASDGARALAVLKTFDAHIVVTDLNMPGLDGKGLLEELRKQPSPPVPIVVTAFGSLETALETVHRLGAFWYIEKPIQAAALKMILERAAEKRILVHHAGLLERELASRGAVGGLVGESAAMQEIFSLIQQVAPTSAPCRSRAKAAPEKRSWRGRFISSARAGPGRSLPSTVRPCRKRSWRASFSVMKKAHSPAR